MSARLGGGCACGAVRYSLSDPYDTGWCHCRVCQRTSGAPAIAFTTARREDFRWETGEPRIYRTTAFGQRRFCGACGTTLTIEIDFQPDDIDVAVATLNDPDTLRPGFHIFCAEAVAWAPIDDGLPRHDKFRPDTRGLPPGVTEPGVG